MKFCYTYIAAAAFLAAACGSHEKILKSPDGRIAVDFELTGDGTPTYSVTFDGKPVISPSDMGFELKGINASSGFSIDAVENSSVTSKWTPVWERMPRLTTSITL